jgi:hypothetical protein
MEEAYRLAQQSANRASAKSKDLHDRGLGSTVLEPGDRVLVRNLSERGGRANYALIGSRWYMWW